MMIYRNSTVKEFSRRQPQRERGVARHGGSCVCCNDRKRTSREACVIELVVREFTVDVSVDQAWDQLARVEQWTSWAKHIKRVTLEPKGPLTESSAGAFRLAGGARSTFRMEVYVPLKRWQWVGRFLTIQVHYDHLFESVDSKHTRLIWTVAAEGPGSATLGRLFGAIYARNLDKAIPNLQAELRAHV
jgi:hypothetical protein